MQLKFGAIFLLVIISMVCETYSECSLTPTGIHKPRNRNIEDKYLIEINGSPKTYTPNERYNVSLKINQKNPSIKPFRNFILTLESANETRIPNRSGGQFDIIRGTDIMVQFSLNCPNTVVGTGTFLISEVQVFWTAPPKNSGCVAIRATVVESKENWYSDDGGLRKTLCEDSSENNNIQPFPLTYCCACDEAKYEVAFEGMWTRNTHPRNFPSDVWSTRFSDIIGASHRKYESFWQYETFASDGLKELAETGLTKTLESELKNNSENIRTIIKARGIHYPNITKSTYAVFRVDNKNHLVSLVSKIVPSPDWIVGVSDLELCQIDCTWEQSRTLNLYPWDIGTDDGIGYTDSEPSTLPRPIRRITPNNPNDPLSPFYNDRGEDMKPIARIHFIRQRVYEKPCGPDHYTSLDDRDCSTTEWTPWASCTAKCGNGYTFRTREHRNPDRALDCPEVLTESKSCFEWASFCSRIGDKKGKEEESLTVTTEDEETTYMSTIPPEDERCNTREWNPWSSCSSQCGKGVKTRDRKMKNSENKEICGGYQFLQENAECEGDESCEINEQTICPDLIWGQWTECNVTCGKGYKSRLGVPQNTSENNSEDEKQELCSLTQTVECEDLCKVEDKTKSTRDTISRLSPDNFIITEEPDGEVIDCKVSHWSKWSECKLNNEEAKCGNGYREKHRSIVIHPENGGKDCPNRLLRRESCVMKCKPSESEDDMEKLKELLGNLSKECKMGSWSKWTPCTSNCGSAAVQLRTREIIYQPTGVTCPNKVEYRRCRLPLICTENKNRID